MTNKFKLLIFFVTLSLVGLGQTWAGCSSHTDQFGHTQVICDDGRIGSIYTNQQNQSSGMIGGKLYNSNTNKSGHTSGMFNNRLINTNTNKYGYTSGTIGNTKVNCYTDAFGNTRCN